MEATTNVVQMLLVCALAASSAEARTKQPLVAADSGVPGAHEAAGVTGQASEFQHVSLKDVIKRVMEANT